ncbi:unnamed protein product [Anisakis simplex]|uniref:THO complex subunit 3 (inferred by orthology to a human protein) n=1 Tax=Anisakis simplex TaxID=6269 RepID=A0A0M3K7Q6_ANISI|nr:unnamed protein product [Anisakis simplex]
MTAGPATESSTSSARRSAMNGIGKLQLFDEAVEHFKKNDRIKIYDMQVPRPLTLSWNCDGTRLACGAEKSVAKDVFHGFGHNEQVDQVAFHPNNAHLFASASSDRTIRIWDVRQTRTHTRLPTRAPNLNVAWSPCGTYLLYGDREDAINMVDGRTYKTLKVEPMKQEANEFAFHPSGQYLFVAMGGGQLSIFKMPEFTHIRTIQAHSSQSTCTCMAVSNDGEHFAVGASDALCSIWNTREMICERALGRLDYPLRSVSFSADSRLIATASEDHSIDIAWTETGARVHELRVNADTYQCAWHPNAYLLAYSCAPAVDSRERDVVVKLFGFTT